MDYAEEQQIEIEALESIYPSEFQLISTDPYVITIDTKSEGFDNGEGLNCTLKFTFTPTYPEEVPEIEIDEEEEDTTNLDETEIQTLKDLLTKEASENTGMAVIFTLVSAATEWLNVEWDRRIKQQEEEEEQRLKAEEEAEQKRFEGTRVSVQTFIAWKTVFDAELRKKREQDSDKVRESDTKKLTGRELFLQDKTLIESDLTEDDGEALPIDESLFEDMEDLDIDEDEDDGAEEDDED